MGALRLALTPGEPAGIGPDLAVRLAQTRQACELVAVGDPEMLAARARLLDLPLTLEPVDYARAPLPAPAGVLRVDAACPAAPTPGRTDPANARYVLDTLDRAVERCRDSSAPHRDRTGAQGGDQRRRHRLFRPHRLSGRAPRRRRAGDDARHRRRRPARRAGHGPYPAVRRPGGRDRGTPRPRAAGHRAGTDRPLRHRPAPAAGRRPEPACGRGRLSRARGDRHHRAGHRRRARAGWTSSARRRRIRCSRRIGWPARTRWWRCITTRACR